MTNDRRNPTEDTPTPDCYCVCHSPNSSAPSCVHCKQDDKDSLVNSTMPVKPVSSKADYASEQDDKLDSSNPPAQKLDKSGQQLRGALEALEVPKMVVWIDKEMKVEITHLTEKTVDEILSLFQKEQLQLVSELEGELPPKKDEHPMEDGVAVEVYGYEAEYNSAIDAVKAVLEHKKQELERSK